MATKEEMIEKAMERGYSMVAQSGDGNWYSFMCDQRPINLQLWIDKEEFELTHMIGMLKLTTTNCGSFMVDSHFERIEKSMNRVIFDLL